MRMSRLTKGVVGVLLVLLMLALGAFVFIPSTEMEFIEQPPTVVGRSASFDDLPQSTMALDCQDKDETCTVVDLKETVENCEEWYTGSPTNELDCDSTTKGIRGVSLLADPANHVRSTFTDRSYTTEVLTPSYLPKWYHPYLSTVNTLITQEWDVVGKGWDLEFLPNGTALLSVKDGRVIHYREGVFDTIADLEVMDRELTGLLGLEVEPRNSGRHAVYVLYTYEPAGRDGYLVHNRISRFTFASGSLVEEDVLLEEIPGSIYHAGGRLERGPDGKLYATVGDADEPERAMDPGFLGGKILRLNPDGSVPSDNPFPGKYVYSRGHRNPQGLAWQPGTGVLYATEHGDWRHDEVNRIVSGGNYGWGRMRCDEVRDEGIELDGEYRPPVRCFDKWTFAPSGATFVDEEGHPWEGDLFVAGLRGNHLRRFVLREGSVVEDEIFYLTMDSMEDIVMDRRLRDVEFHEGSLWVLSDWSGLMRLSPDE